MSTREDPRARPRALKRAVLVDALDRDLAGLRVPAGVHRTGRLVQTLFGGAGARAFARAWLALRPADVDRAFAELLPRAGGRGRDARRLRAAMRRRGLRVPSPRATSPERPDE